jgi:predicted transcriptional regulator
VKLKESVNIKEIAEGTGLPVESVKKHIKTLLRLGLIKESEIKNKHYKAHVLKDGCVTH